MDEGGWIEGFILAAPSIAFVAIIVSWLVSR